MSTAGGTQENNNELSKFRNLQKIGEGTYGQVYVGIHKKTQQKIALKKIALDKDQEGIPSTCLREIALLKELHHPHIVRLYDVICTSNRLYLVFEFIDRDLKVLLDKLPRKKLLPQYCKSFVWQLLQALAYCHTRRIIHRDLKPQNILVTNSGTIKLADFGLARVFTIPSRVYTHEVVTLWYRPPEVLLGGKYYSTALDIWSLGCIFIEMATGKPIFNGDCEIDQLFKIFKIMGTPNPTIWPGVEKLPDYKENFPKWKRLDEEVIMTKIMGELNQDGQDLALQMLCYLPSKRITAKAALGHRYLGHGLLPIPSVTDLFVHHNINISPGTTADLHNNSYNAGSEDNGQI